MAVEAVALVLREHDDLQVAGVGEVRQREVDQAVRPTERDGRLGAVVGEREKSLPLSAGEDDDENLRLGHGTESTQRRAISRSYSSMYSAAGLRHDQSTAIPRRCNVAWRLRSCDPSAGPEHRRQQIGRRRSGGDEAATVATVGVGIGHGVDETADTGDDRYGAVPHRLHLRQPARLEAARHHEQVGAGEHEVRQ